ncbi:pentatricopeptide repeat-containing protein At1g11290, chloroplastic [Elaeis guineensis]|uniref:pentatricopeptide repeat-containing protein At1g11290, chloroplastic n=1 Tax=Elaeis guineensis var. tenera TaxID=51953 RepID=UPI003C6D9A3E
MLRRFASPLLLCRRRTAVHTASHFISPVSSDTGSDSDDALDLQTPCHLRAAPYDFVRILSAAAKSSSIATGQQTHTAVIKLGLASNLFITTALLDVYCKCRRISEAQRLFEEMPKRNVVTWNALIHGHSQSEIPILAIRAFVQMVSQGIFPSPSTVSSVLVACSRSGVLGYGMMLHCVGFKHGFCSNVVVGTALVDMYSKCCDMGVARRVFDEMDERNVITWTSLVTGYVLQRRPYDAMLLVREMRHLGVRLNKVTYNSLLSSFSRPEDLVHGKQVHCLVLREGLEADPYIAVTLVTMYSKCGSLEDFVKAYPTVSRQDQISCNSIIAAFSHLGDGKEAIEKFLKMRRECIDTDFFTFASVLRAIGMLSALEEGKQIHTLVWKTGHASNVCVQNGLVSMYAKCGAISDSKKVFSSMAEPDLVSWNSLIAGCAQHGYGRKAVELFEQMRQIGVRQDRTTFLSVLTACSHAGLVEKGLEFFYLMKDGDSPVVAGLEHYACVVDLLGRAGYLHEAETFVNNMPIKPSLSVYRALLSACRIHGNVEIAKRAAESLFELCPNDHSTHVLLSNVFAADGCWDKATGVRKTMLGKGLKKKPAWTWIEDRIPLGALEGLA